LFSFDIPDGATRTVNVVAGNYYILVRYGTAADRYFYARGSKFKIPSKQISASATSISLLLPGIGSNPTQVISSAEFERLSTPAILPTVRSIYCAPEASYPWEGDPRKWFWLQAKIQLFKAGFTIVEYQGLADAILRGNVDTRTYWNRTRRFSATASLYGRDGQFLWAWSADPQCVNLEQDFSYEAMGSCVKKFITALAKEQDQDEGLVGENANVAGRWVAEKAPDKHWPGKGAPDEVKNQTVFVFQINENQLMGTLVIGREKTNIVYGKLAGDQISFSAYFGESERIYRGKVSGDEINFTVMLENCAGKTLEITAKRVS